MLAYEADYIDKEGNLVTITGEFNTKTEDISIRYEGDISFLELVKVDPWRALIDTLWGPTLLAIVIIAIMAPVLAVRARTVEQQAVYSMGESVPSWGEGAPSWGGDVPSWDTGGTAHIPSGLEPHEMSAEQFDERKLTLPSKEWSTTLTTDPTIVYQNLQGILSSMHYVHEGYSEGDVLFHGVYSATHSGSQSTIALSIEMDMTTWVFKICVYGEDEEAVTTLLHQVSTAAGS